MSLSDRARTQMLHFATVRCAILCLTTAACVGPPSPLETAAETKDETGKPEQGSESLTAMPGFSWVVEAKLAGMPLPGGTRSLNQDLEYLKTQRISLLISLTEQPIDSAVLEALGIDALHLPVPDFHAPTLEQLIAFVVRVNRALAQGESVGVHCTAGLGRTGTVVAAYFVSEGLTAQAAIAKIRRLRPGSVETADQEQRIREYAASLGTR